MTHLLVIGLLAVALIVLMGTFMGVSNLHRDRRARPAPGDNGPGTPFSFRLNWPIVDWLLRQDERFQAALPGFYHPIGSVYGFVASVWAWALLLVAHYAVALVGVVIGYFAVYYSSEGVSQALNRSKYLRALVAVTGVILGITALVLHIVALFGRRLLPAWEL